MHLNVQRARVHFVRGGLMHRTATAHAPYGRLFPRVVAVYFAKQIQHRLGCLRSLIGVGLDALHDRPGDRPVDLGAKLRDRRQTT